MPSSYDKLVKELKKKMAQGKIRKTYVRHGKRHKTNVYALAKAILARRK